MLMDSYHDWLKFAVSSEDSSSKIMMKQDPWFLHAFKFLYGFHRRKIKLSSLYWNTGTLSTYFSWLQNIMNTSCKTDLGLLEKKYISGQPRFSLCWDKTSYIMEFVNFRLDKKDEHHQLLEIEFSRYFSVT